MVRGSRAALLNYCVLIQPEHLVQPVDAFAGRSIAYLLGHVADTYIKWIVATGLQRTVAYYEDQYPVSIDEIKLMFERVDDDMSAFLEHFGGRELSSLRVARPGEQELTFIPLLLFTHATTHEFHHKGQVLSMSRLLGYTPVDTDVIRFE